MQDSEEITPKVRYYLIKKSFRLKKWHWIAVGKNNETLCSSAPYWNEGDAKDTIALMKENSQTAPVMIFEENRRGKRTFIRSIAVCIAFILLSMAAFSQTRVKPADNAEYKRYGDYCNKWVPVIAVQIGKVTVDWNTKLTPKQTGGMTLVRTVSYSIQRGDTTSILTMVYPISISFDKNAALKKEVNWGILYREKSKSDPAKLDTIISPMKVSWMVPIIPKYAHYNDTTKILNEYSFSGKQLVLPSSFVVFVRQREKRIADFYGWWMKLAVKPK